MPPSLGERLLFVVGAPRSGTTLLMRMLNVHPDVHTRPEPHLLTPLAHLGYYGYVDKAPYDPFQSAEAARAFVDDLPRGEEDYLDALRAYADTLYGRMLATSGKRLFLDKTPAYALVLPFVARLYPEAAYLVVTRHPFAIFASYARSFFDDDWDAAHRFNPVLERYVPALASFLRDPPAERVHHVRYEALVAEPEAELRVICRTAGVPFLPELVTYGHKAVEGRGLGDPTEIDRHERPVTTSVDRWAAHVVDRPDRLELLRAVLARLTDEDLAVWGLDRTTIWEPLDAVDPAAASRERARARRWDRHHLERKALLHVRRSLRHRALGRVLRRVRFYCDVLLRE